MQTAFNILSAIALAGLFGIGQFADQVDDQRAERASSQSLTDAQRAAAETARRDLAAARLCREQHGKAGFTWTADGALVCIPRRGRPVIERSAP